MLCQWGTAAPGRYPDNRWANPSKAGLCLHRSHQHRVEGRITHLCSAQSPDGLSAPFPNPLLASHRGIWILCVLNHGVMKSSRNKQNPLEVQHRPTFHMVAGGLLVSYSPGSSQGLSATAVLRAGFLLGRCLESILSQIFIFLNFISLLLLGRKGYEMFWTFHP